MDTPDHPDFQTRGPIIWANCPACGYDIPDDDLDHCVEVRWDRTTAYAKVTTCPDAD